MFFIHKNEHGDTPFYFTMVYDGLKNNEWESLLKRVSGSLSNIDFSKLLLEKDKFGMIYLHRTSLKLLQLIWNSIGVSLHESDRKKMLSAPGEKGFNFLMNALHKNRGELVDYVLKEAKKIFSKKGELRKYLEYESEDNETCLHIAASFSGWKVFENLWNFFKKNYPDSRLKSFLFKNSFYKQIILLVLAKKNRPNNSFIKDFLNFHRDLNLINERQKESFLSQI